MKLSTKVGQRNIVDAMTFSLVELICLLQRHSSGASKDTPGDATCVTEILGWGKNKEVGGQI